MTRFAEIYYIDNNAGTYEAWQDDEPAATYSGTSLVTDVLNQIESANPTGNFAVIFGVGTFDMGTENWALNTVTNIMIAGAGIDATTVQNFTNAAADSEPFSFTAADKITIQDMTVAAGGADRSTSDAIDFDAGDDCLVQRVRVTNSRGDGIVFDGKDGTIARRNTVRNCEITGAFLSGIQLLASDQNVIDGNWIHGNGESGIKVNRDTSPVQDSFANVIQGNHIYANNEAGIEILDCSRTLVIGNVIYNNGQSPGTYDDGIVIDDFVGGPGAANNLIIGNLIYDDQTGVETQNRAINLNDAGVTGTVITGNYIGLHNQTGAARINDLATGTIIRNNDGYPDKIAIELTAGRILTVTDPPVINAESTGGVVAITLPDNADSVGKSFLIRRDGTNNVTITRTGTDTFDDAATSKTLGADSSAIGIFSIGDGEWKIVATEGTVT